MILEFDAGALWFHLDLFSLGLTGVNSIPSVRPLIVELGDGFGAESREQRETVSV